MYFFKGCNFSSSLARHLVLARPGLTAPGHPTTPPPPLLKRNSRFASCHSKTHPLRRLSAKTTVVSSLIHQPFAQTVCAAELPPQEASAPRLVVPAAAP